MKDDLAHTEHDSTRKFINIALWVVVIAWVSIVGYDYYRSVKELRPKFCITEKTINYSDGTVYQCIGPGYKYYAYNRATFKGSKFGGFWINE